MVIFLNNLLLLENFDLTYCVRRSVVIFTDFKPRGVAVGMIPGLPAFLLLKLLRFADYSNDDKMIKQLLQHIINGIKKVEKVG